jgi:uncharacterized iron-regulated membrane protein
VPFFSLHVSTRRRLWLTEDLQQTAAKRGGYALTFDLHRSGGVWIWGLFTIVALTSVSTAPPATSSCRCSSAALGAHPRSWRADSDQRGGGGGGRNERHGPAGLAEEAERAAPFSAKRESREKHGRRGSALVIRAEKVGADLGRLRPYRHTF